MQTFPEDLDGCIGNKNLLYEIIHWNKQHNIAWIVFLQKKWFVYRKRDNNVAFTKIHEE